MQQPNARQNVQLVGLCLWRFGLLLAGGTAVYRTCRFALRLIDIPTQLEIGIGLLVTGAVFIIGSYAAERYVDYRAEGDLTA